VFVGAAACIASGGFVRRAAYIANPHPVQTTMMEKKLYLGSNPLLVQIFMKLAKSADTKLHECL
jgi:hypothetical protein